MDLYHRGLHEQSVGNFRPTEREVRYQREQFYESLRVQGIPAILYSIKPGEDSFDFYGDVDERAQPYRKGFKTLITYDVLPTIKTLRSLGWYHEQEDLPIIAHIPLLYENAETKELTEFRPKIDDMIELESNPYDTGEENDTRQYQIKKLKGVGFPSTIYYIANVVPYRRNFSEDI